MKTKSGFLYRIGKDFVTYWQLYLVTILVASLILLFLGVFDFSSIINSLVE